MPDSLFPFRIPCLTHEIDYFGVQLLAVLDTKLSYSTVNMLDFLKILPLCFFDPWVPRVLLVLVRLIFHFRIRSCSCCVRRRFATIICSFRGGDIRLLLDWLHHFPSFFRCLALPHQRSDVCSIVPMLERLATFGRAAWARVPTKRSARLSGRASLCPIGTIIACVGCYWRVIFSSRLHLLILVILLTSFLLLRLVATSSGILLLTHFNQKQSKRFNRKFIIYGISIRFLLFINYAYSNYAEYLYRINLWIF